MNNDWYDFTKSSTQQQCFSYLTVDLVYKVTQSDHLSVFNVSNIRPQAMLEISWASIRGFHTIIFSFFLRIVIDVLTHSGFTLRGFHCNRAKPRYLMFQRLSYSLVQRESVG